MHEIKSIETEYNGVLFRSRLEARWAVFFDNLRVDWRYEFEGYETSTGYYLPDFYLPNVYMRDTRQKGVLFEVKPESYEGTEHDQLTEVGRALGVSGMLAKGFQYNGAHDWDGLYQVALGWDDNMMIYKCSCGKVKFDYHEANYMECPNPHCKEILEPMACWLAYNAANTYRFW